MKLRLVAPLSAALIMCLAATTPVAAFSVLKHTGKTGDYGVRSNEDGPEVVCGYTASNGGANVLKFLKVFPLGAGPAGTKTSQRVSWVVKIQSSLNSSGPWKTVKTAPKQTRTVTNSSGPSYKSVKVAFASKPGLLYRAVSTLTWLTNGKASGLVRMRMTTYGAKFGDVPGSVIFDNYCTGAILD